MWGAPINIEELLKIMALLRDEEQGCPWDRKQTFQTIAPHTLEEVYEVIDTIERRDYDHLANELGDLLFQIVFYAQLGKEQGLFDFGDIVREISKKLLTRHPHVFPEATIESFGSQKRLTPEQVEGKWEQIKQEERKNRSAGTTSILEDIPKALPAMSRARKIQKRAATVGFDWTDSKDVLDKVREEIDELEESMDSDSLEHMEEELGDLFFSLVNLARHMKIDPEGSLRKANDKFESRFRRLEEKVVADGKTPGELSLEELDRYWRDIKRDS